MSRTTAHSPRLAPSSLANQSQNVHSQKCCYMSSRFINLVLFVFNFIFLLSGAIILLLTVLYGRPEVSKYLGETTKYLNNIISLLGSGHLVQIIHYSMLFCGITISVISLINITLSVAVSWSKSGDHYYYRRKQKLNETDQSLLFHSTLDSNRTRKLSLNDTVRSTLEARTQKEHSRSLSHCAHSSCALCCYIFVMLFLFTVQLVIGLISVVTVTPEHIIIQAAHSHETNDDFLISVRESVDIPHLLIDRASDIEPLYAAFHCCGWLFFDDYEYLKQEQKHNKSAPVPDACCKTVVKNCGVRKHPNNIYYDGCWQRFGAEMRDYVLMLGWTALTFAVVELIGVIFAICLYVQVVSRV